MIGCGIEGCGFGLVASKTWLIINLDGAFVIVSGRACWGSWTGLFEGAFFREAGLQGEKDVSDMYLRDVTTSQTSTSFSVKQDTNQSVT